MAPKFKLVIQDENGRDIEDTGDPVEGNFESEDKAAADFLAELEAFNAIAQAEDAVNSVGGDRANDTGMTFREVGVTVTLMCGDVVRAFRQLIQDADIPPSARETLLADGRVLVEEIGSSLDQTVRLLVGAEEPSEKSYQN